MTKSRGILPNPRGKHRDGRLVPKGKYTCAQCSAEYEVKGHSKRRVKTDKGWCPTCMRRSSMVVAHAAAKAQRQVVQEAYKERVQEEAAKSAQLVAEAVKMEMKKGMDDAVMLLHEVHRTTTSVVSPEQVQEIMRNVEMIRAPTDGLTTEQLVKRELVIRELCRRKLIYFTARRRPETGRRTSRRASRRVGLRRCCGP